MHTRCTQVHTHGRTDIRTHVRSEAGTQVQTWKLGVRSKKLEVRSKKLEIRNAAHALLNARMCEQTFGRTNMHADRQMDGRTQTYTLTHACMQTHERMH